MPHKIGLVLSGGGGKGAYEAGVWKALEEYGITRNISVISGTSVGALNAAIFACQDVPTIEKIWTEIGPSDIMTVDVESVIKKIAKVLMPVFVKLNRLTVVMSFIRELLKYGTFSRKGLVRIIEQYLDPAEIARTSRKIYCTCTRLSLPPRANAFLLNYEPFENMKNILLASSAIPVVFGQEKIRGKAFWDGGIVDNSPVTPVYRENCDIIIVVFLDRADYINTDDFPNSKFIFIYPKSDPGGLFSGVLNFRKGAEKIDKGYEDAKKVIEPVYDMAKANFMENRLIKRMRHSMDEFFGDMSVRTRTGGEIDASIQDLLEKVEKL